MVRKLAEGDYLSRSEPIVLLGETGSLRLILGLQYHTQCPEKSQIN